MPPLWGWLTHKRVDAGVVERDGRRYRKQVKRRRFPRPSRQLMYSSLAVLLAGVLSLWAFPRLVGAVDSFLNESARGEDR